MERLSEDDSYTGELMLCWGLVQTRRENMSPDEHKTVILLEYLGDPHHGYTKKAHDTKYGPIY